MPANKLKQNHPEPYFLIDHMDEIIAERNHMAEKVTKLGRHCSRCKEPVVFARGQRCGNCGYRM